MKFVFHRGKRPLDLTRLRTQFPAMTFLDSTTLADIESHVADMDVFVIGNTQYTKEVSALLRARAKKLRWIQITASGVDDAVKAGGFPDGVIVTNAAGLRAPNVSEHVFALLLFLTRRLRRVEEARADHRWALDDLFTNCLTLHRKTMLIVGMGAIGQALARKARAFDMQVHAISRGYKADGTVSKVFSREEATQAFAQADVVVLSLPARGDTQRFVSRELFAAMKPSAFLINIARGAVVDEEALIEACASKRIAGAGIDVTVTEPLPASSPLWSLDNVVLTPHLGGGGGDDGPALIDMIAENIVLYGEGKPLKRRVEL